MFTIDIEKRCSCVRKDDALTLPQHFPTREKAAFEALRLANHMNANYCKKHRFFVTEEGEKLTIRVELACPQEIV